MIKHFKSNISKLAAILCISIFSVAILGSSQKTFAAGDVKSAFGFTESSDNKYDDLLTENRVIKSFDGGSSSEDGLKNVFIDSVIPVINILIALPAIIYLIVIGFKLVFSGGEEEEINNSKKTFGYISMGLVVISVAEVIAFQVFDPSSDFLSKDSAGLGQLKETGNLIKTYLQYIVGGLVLLKGVIVAMQMVSGDSDENEKSETAQKDFFKSILIGSLVVFSAEVMVEGIFFVNQDEADALAGIKLIASFVNLALSLISVAAVGMLTLSGIYFVANFGNEEAVNHAKSIIMGSVIALVMSYSSFTLSRFIFSSYFGF